MLDASPPHGRWQNCCRTLSRFGPPACLLSAVGGRRVAVRFCPAKQRQGECSSFCSLSRWTTYSGLLNPRAQEVVPDPNINLKIDLAEVPSKLKPARASNVQTVTLCRKGVGYGQSSLTGCGIWSSLLSQRCGAPGIIIDGARLLFWVAILGWRPHEARRRLASPKLRAGCGQCNTLRSLHSIGLKKA